MNDIKVVDLYTDGACEPNPGKGGWGAILMFNGREKILSGYDEFATNNKMELTAVIKGLEALKEPCVVNIYSDSAYVVNAFIKNWIDSWVRNNWKTSTGNDVANKNLWEELIKFSKTHKLNFIKVKGHSDNVNNQRCDDLAVGEIKKRG